MDSRGSPRLQCCGTRVTQRSPLSIGSLLAVALLSCASVAWPQTATPDAQPSPGTISGRILDDSGAAIAEARVTLSRDGILPGIEIVSGADGQFLFAAVSAGTYRLTISASGYAGQTMSGVLNPGERSRLPPIRLTLALGAVAVDVTPTRAELAQRQIEEQEQQRLFGVLPNFFVTYNADAVPLSAGQKFELSWKARLDPVQFGVVGIIAAIQQVRNDYAGFGEGAEGYARRYAAAYANVLTRSLVTQVLMPSLFKQDPRYFHKGTGSTKSRMGYALSRAVIRKGDNRRWQPNYSGIFGGLASGGLSNLYYPTEDRRGVRLTLETAAIGLGGAAAGYLAQEFLFKRVTSRARAAQHRARRHTAFASVVADQTKDLARTGTDRTE